MTKESFDKIQQSHAYRDDFKYKHDNPYHHKLKEFDDFVFLDTDPEKMKGKWQEHFSNSAEICAEIGTGYGHFMIEYVQENPEHNFIGLDYRFKRSFQLAKRLAKVPHRNFRYLRAKGERLEYLFDKNEVDHLFYFFPDPWPKTRHLKKRLFQQPFLEAAFKSLKPGGTFWIKTDHVGYFEWMQREEKKFGKFEKALISYDIHNEFPDNLLSRFPTKFEKIFMKQSIPTKAMILKKPMA